LRTMVHPQDVAVFLARVWYHTICRRPYKDNHPGPVKAWELSPERLARARRSAEWGRQFAEGMSKNLQEVAR
jgi:hypothetical protein